MTIWKKGYTTTKKFDRNLWQREYRRNNKNKCTKKYEKTKQGFLMRLYRNMKSRVSGIQKTKYHLYAFCSLLPKEEFYSWANNSSEFHRLWDEWELMGRDRKFTPSVDRVDSSRGYTLDNMEWVTHSENSRRGNQNRYAANYR